MNDNEKDFYQKLRIDIKKWIEKNAGADPKITDILLLAPDIFHLLVKLSLDPEVPSAKKMKLAAAVAYFISPVDLIPEIIVGPLGYMDDIAIAAYVLNDIINNVDPVLVKKHWSGERDILDLIKTILANANNLIGAGLWNKVKKRFG